MMRKRIKWIVALLIVGGVTGWICSRWDAWFSMPEEPPYTASMYPSRIMLTFGSSEEDSRNISWQCDSIVRPSFIEYQCGEGTPKKEKATGELFHSRSGKSVFYAARLRQLLPDTTYHYRVCTNGKYSDWYSFRTYPTHRNEFEFVYVGDVQDSINGKANELLKSAFHQHPNAEMLVCGGDLTERPSDNYWEETFRDLDSICQHVPLLVATGNHDYLKTVPMKLERRFSLTFSYFLDAMEGENQLYNLRYANAEFFLLDSNREPNFLWTQRSWLKKKLQESKAQWKIVILHHPLYSLKGGMNNLPQRLLFDGLIREYGVDLVLQAHEHEYARMTNKVDVDGAPQMMTTPVYTVSHCSPKNYRISFPDEYDRFGLSSRYYQTVRVKGDTLQMAAYDAYNHQLYDSLLIVKSSQGTTRVVDLARHIPEKMDFQPRPDSKKDMKFAKRIKDYCDRHPEQINPNRAK